MTARSSHREAPTARADDEEENLPLELEHILGFTGSKAGTLLAHPRLAEVYVKSMGSAVVIADLNDPHQQASQLKYRGTFRELQSDAISASVSPALLRCVPIHLLTQKRTMDDLHFNHPSPRQEFLRGHDMEISALALSASGNMLASGQLGTVHRKGYGKLGCSKGSLLLIAAALLGNSSILIRLCPTPSHSLRFP